MLHHFRRDDHQTGAGYGSIGGASRPAIRQQFDTPPPALARAIAGDDSDGLPF